LTGLAVPLGAAAVALLLTSAGPAAAGSGYGQLIANPGTVAPGQSISVLGTCPNNGQGGLNGVYSSAFVGGSASVTTTSINFSGTAMIASNASGKYTVTADCGGGNPTLTITVSTTVVSTTSTPAATTAAAVPTAVHTTAVAPPAVKTSTAAIVGGTTPAKSATPVPSSPGTTAAANGPVTSTGIVRVGLAGASHSALTMTGAAAIAIAIVLAGGLGFLMIRRRRTSSGSHS